MKTNSELPLTLLHKNEELNSMDFVLFHLYETYPEYRQYYKELRSRTDRTVILDNSGYEYFVQGKTLDCDAFVKAINDLEPDYYILPDVLMDMVATIDGSYAFLKDHEHMVMTKKSKPMIVCQGKTAAELEASMNCYLEAGFKYLAIPFHNSFFKEYVSARMEAAWKKQFHVAELTEDMRYAAGRCEFIMHNKLLLAGFDYIHLLGSHNIFEKRFCWLHAPELIDSMDTGYPTKMGIAGHRVMDVVPKPNIIIDDFFDKELDESTKQLIIDNVLTFKNL